MKPLLGKLESFASEMYKQTTRFGNKNVFSVFSTVDVRTEDPSFIFDGSSKV